jgi:hypothetical protein
MTRVVLMTRRQTHKFEVEAGLLYAHSGLFHAIAPQRGLDDEAGSDSSADDDEDHRDGMCVGTCTDDATTLAAFVTMLQGSDRWRTRHAPQVIKLMRLCSFMDAPRLVLQCWGGLLLSDAGPGTLKSSINTERSEWLSEWLGEMRATRRGLLADAVAHVFNGMSVYLAERVLRTVRERLKV